MYLPLAERKCLANAGIFSTSSFHTPAFLFPVQQKPSVPRVRTELRWTDRQKTAVSFPVPNCLSILLFLCCNCSHAVRVRRRFIKSTMVLEFRPRRYANIKQSLPCGSGCAQLVMVWFIDHFTVVSLNQKIYLNICELHGHGAVFHTYFQVWWRSEKNRITTNVLYRKVGLLRGTGAAEARGQTCETGHRSIFFSLCGLKIRSGKRVKRAD